MEQNTLLLVTGLIAILGSLIYAVGDVLLLAGKINIEDYPKLKPFIKLLSDTERMAAFSPIRMTWGALLGVFASPLLLAGYWQIYQGLQGATPPLVLTSVLLFIIALPIGAFVHGTFYYMGEYIRALNKVDENSQKIIADMIARHRRVLVVAYAPLLTLIIIASILFSVMVGTGTTHFPAWMAAVNPVTLTIAWLVIKRILPQFVRDWTEGAGFNIAYLAFFICTTITLV